MLFFIKKRNRAAGFKALTSFHFVGNQELKYPDVGTTFLDSIGILEVQGSQLFQVRVVCVIYSHPCIVLLQNLYPSFMMSRLKDYKAENVNVPPFSFFFSFLRSKQMCAMYLYLSSCYVSFPSVSKNITGRKLYWNSTIFYRPIWLIPALKCQYPYLESCILRTC